MAASQSKMDASSENRSDYFLIKAASRSSRRCSNSRSSAFTFISRSANDGSPGLERRMPRASLIAVVCSALLDLCLGWFVMALLPKNLRPMHGKKLLVRQDCILRQLERLAFVGSKVFSYCSLW